MEAKLNFSYGVFERPPKDDDLIYYYCSMETFFSIITSKTIWLRNLLEMNDPSELLLHKVNIVDHIINRYKNNLFEFKYIDKENKEALIAYLSSTFFQFTSGINGINNNFFFALCMSSEEDSLGQWRAYADNGKGVCLGFNKHTIKNYIKDKSNLQLQEIEYFDDIDAIIDKICYSMLDEIKEIYRSKDEKQLKEYPYNILSHCMQNWSKYKTCDYSMEKETRLVYKKHTDKMCMNIDAIDIDSDFLSDLEFSILKGQIDLHAQININNLGLSTITLGPLNNTSKCALNMFLAKNSIYVSRDKIYKSLIPYRD